MKYYPIKSLNNKYGISVCGRIFNYKTNREIKPTYSTKGYLQIGIVLNGKRTTRKVHRLLLETFKPNNATGLETNHKNGIKDDNRLRNLEWVTSRENKLHAWETGLHPKTKTVPSSQRRFTYEISQKIRKEYETVKNYVILGKKYGVSRESIRKIIKGKTYAF